MPGSLFRLLTRTLSRRTQVLDSQSLYGQTNGVYGAFRILHFCPIIQRIQHTCLPHITFSSSPSGLWEVSAWPIYPAGKALNHKLPALKRLQGTRGIFTTTNMAIVHAEASFNPCRAAKLSSLST